MNCTHELVTGNHLYSGRVLGATEPSDIIQLHPDLKPQWSAITSHYARIGLRHSQNPIWDVELSVLAEYPNYDLSLFFFGNATNDTHFDKTWFRQLDENWFNVVDFINSKNNFMELAHELGVSVPQTLCFADKAAINTSDKFPYPCYLKPAVSVDGAGICRCETPQQLTQALKALPDNLPLQIQQELKTSQFLNLQYRVTPSGVERLATSEQILTGCAHCGNRYPTTHQPWELVEPMALWMAQRGMKEIFAFDVAVVEDSEETHYLAIECNPRFNGASYPTVVAKKLNITHWSCETFTTQYRSLNELNLGDIEFNPQNGTGIIIVNWGTIAIGKIVVLLAGSIETQNELRALLKQRL
ncbi:ATP-grasp domain-containing protein [Coleofasciculus sp. LEGE 07092]|nr:ATP-grasp domain-containing protein [Coleofasciculus sp. LEGE 07081]MBE9151135.1 ATP-grasp domain-containing protein [Coleofasciculus sp. LEGE 07092]